MGNGINCHRGKARPQSARGLCLWGSILLHDAAMTLAAYPDGLAGLKKEIAWQDSYARLAASASEKGEETNSAIEAKATAEALRRLHAFQAEKLLTMSWKDKQGTDEFLIDDAEVRRFYGPSIGRVAH